jgi:photosystem II stability/assembly factor-like uncharacterized protein
MRVDGMEVGRVWPLGFAVFLMCACFLIAASAEASEPSISRRPALALDGEIVNDEDLGLVLDVTKVGAGRLVAVGERGKIAISDDAGKTWLIRPTPIDVTLTSVATVEMARIVAVGHEGTILESSDEGQSWRLIETKKSAGPYLRIRTFPGGRTFVLGARGVLLENFGRHWRRRLLSTSEGFDAHLFDIAETSDRNYVIAAEAGTLYLGGFRNSSWKQVSSPYRGSLFGVVAVKHGNLFAYGMRGTVLKSRDGGMTWNVEIAPNDDSLFGAAIKGNTAVFGGQDGVVLALNLEAPSSLALCRLPDRATVTSVISVEQEWLLTTTNGVVKGWNGCE